MTSDRHSPARLLNDHHQSTADDDGVFLAKLELAWLLLIAEGDRLYALGDQSAPLRALLLATAVADGTIVSVKQARKKLKHSCTL